MADLPPYWLVPALVATAPQCLRMTRNQAHCRDQIDEETLMKWVACAESAVEIFANGQVRLSGRATSVPLADPACARTHVVAHTSNISRRMVQIMCLRYSAGAGDKPANVGSLKLTRVFPTG